MTELPKGVQLAIQSTIAMLLPKDVVSKMEPVIADINLAITEFRENMISVREDQVSIRQTLEAIQDECASINARLDSATSAEGKPERSRKRGGPQCPADTVG